MNHAFDRRAFMAYFSALGLTGTAFPGALYAEAQHRRPPSDEEPRPDEEPITTEMIAAAEKVAGLQFTAEERQMMVEDLKENLEQYAALRKLDLPNGVPPAVVFDPRLGGAPLPDGEASLQWEPQRVDRPASDEDLAFMTVAELAFLLREQQVTSAELTALYLARLKRYDPALKAVVTLTEDRARREAARADEEISSGNWRGPLHGVPYGAKDLLAVEGYPTTWGAAPYKEQTLDATAAVVEKLEAAGAVLVAKLALGALAWGDVWFGGTTKNPWNTEQGSSGSSAGPGAAVAAGLVGFAIGSETLGSIVSPATRTGVTGHRPTFGAVSRHGAMTLAWTLDKLGPMARSAEDCALVFEAIRGADPRDPASVAMPFPYDESAGLGGLRVGYLKAAFEEDYANKAADQQTLEVVRGLDVELRPVRLPQGLPVEAMLTTLSVEAAAAFDALTRSGRDDLMVRQEKNAWPHTFRTARLVPAVEHVQMERARTLLMRQTAEAVRDVDVFIAPSFGGQVLQITNLTGHPCVGVPNVFRPAEDQPTGSPRRQPGSISFIGGLYQDAAALTLARAYQQATDFHRRRPPIQ